MKGASSSSVRQGDKSLTNCSPEHPSATINPERATSQHRPIEGSTSMRLDEFLTSNHVPFERLQHREVFSSNRVAQALHVSGREVAKSVLLRSRAGYALAVLPATH